MEGIGRSVLEEGPVADGGTDRRTRAVVLAAVVSLCASAVWAQGVPGSIILATGDEVSGAGRVGSYGVGILGLDDLGRALIRADDSSGNLFWADGERIEPAVNGVDTSPDYLRFEEVSLAGSLALVVYANAAGAQFTVYAVSSGRLKRVVAVGERDADGNTLCWIEHVHINDHGTVAFSAPVVPEGLSCDAWRSEDPVVEYNVYVASEGIHKVYGKGIPFSPGVETEEGRLVAIANDGSVVVASQLSGADAVLLVAEGRVRRALVAVGQVGPAGFPLESITLRRGNRAGEVVFTAREGGLRGLYRTGGGGVRRLLVEGELMPWGETLYSSEIQSGWLTLNDVGDVLVGIASRALLLPAGGAAPEVVAYPALYGFVNNSGEVVVIDHSTPEVYRAVRLRDGEPRTLVSTGDQLPGGEVLAAHGIGASCLAPNGTVAASLRAVSGEAVLACGDAQGFRPVSRFGDPTPVGRRFYSFDQCGFDAAGTLLFAGSTLVPLNEPATYRVDAAIFRATADGIERLIGPGDRAADGSIVRTLRQLPDAVPSRVFDVNAAQQVLAFAMFGIPPYTNGAFIVRREDGVIERLPAALRREGGYGGGITFPDYSAIDYDWLAGVSPPRAETGVLRTDSPSMASTASADEARWGARQVALSDSGSVFILSSECRHPNGCGSSYDDESVILEWLGGEIRRVASVHDLAEPNASSPMFEHLVAAGDHIAFTATRLAGWSDASNRIFTYTSGEASPTEVVRAGDDSPLGPLHNPFTVAITATRTIYFVDSSTGSEPMTLFSWHDGQIEVVGEWPGYATLEAAGADKLLLSDIRQRLATLRLVGSPTGDASCPAPPTAVLPSPTVTATPRPTATPLPPFDPLPLATCQEGRSCVRVGSAVGSVGEAVRFEVSFDAGGAQVTDINGSLLLPPVLDLISCELDPSIDKPGSWFSGEWLFLWTRIGSAEDVDPIPDGALLYSCTAMLSAQAPVGAYPIRCYDFRLFTLHGDGVPSSCSDGVLIVEVRTATPTNTATATPQPSPSRSATVNTPTETPLPTVARDRSADGCQIDRSGEAASAWSIVIGALVLLALHPLRKARWRPSSERVAILTLAILPLASRADARCAGDCDGDGRVGVAELLYQVSVAVGHRPLGDCGSADADFDGALSPAELITSVGSALHGCPRPAQFAAVQYLAVGSISDVTVADIDGDRVPDLITTDHLADEVWVFPGRGDGTFGPGTSHSLGPRLGDLCGGEYARSMSGPLAVEVADVDGDGGADVVTGDFCFDPLYLYLGNAAVAPLEVGPGRVPRFASTRDPEDLAGASERNISVLLGQGNGTFSPAQHYPSTLLFGYSDLKVADVNQDAIPDLVAPHEHGVLVHFGDAAGDFSSPQYVYDDFTWLPLAVEIADLDRDGVRDIALLSSVSENVSLFRGTGGGAFEMRPGIGVWRGASDLAVVDVNRDGAPDVLVSAFENDLLLYLSVRRGGFASSQRIGPTGAGPIDIAVADLNGDGWPDFVTADAYYRSVSVFVQHVAD